MLLTKDNSYKSSRAIIRSAKISGRLATKISVSLDITIRYSSSDTISIQLDVFGNKIENKKA